MNVGTPQETLECAVEDDDCHYYRPFTIQTCLSSDDGECVFRRERLRSARSCRSSLLTSALRGLETPVDVFPFIDGNCSDGLLSPALLNREMSNFPTCSEPWRILLFSISSYDMLTKELGPLEVYLLRECLLSGSLEYAVAKRRSILKNVTRYSLHKTSWNRYFSDWRPSYSVDAW